MGREALYAAGYLGLCPVLYDQLKDSPALQVCAWEGGRDRREAAWAGGSSSEVQQAVWVPTPLLPGTCQ
jgi:hypothetical protein